MRIPPLHLQGRDAQAAMPPAWLRIAGGNPHLLIMRSMVEGPFDRKKPLHRASCGPPPLEIEGRITLNRAIPPAPVDAHRPHLDAMLPRVADDLGGGVEAHRLGVEQGRAEQVGMMAFHPGRGVGDLGEAGGVALGKAVAAEALDLLERPLGEVARIAVARSCR